MAISAPGWGRSVTTLAVLAGAAVAASQTGNSGPISAPSTPGAAHAVFEPKALTVVTTRSLWEPSDWTQTANVLIRTDAMKDTAAAIAHGVRTQLSSDDGRKLAVTLRDPVCDSDGRPLTEQDPACLGDTVRAAMKLSIKGPGEYGGVLALKPLDADSAALELTVKARHHWLLPLLVLFLGALASAVGQVFYSNYRARKEGRAPSAKLVRRQWITDAGGRTPLLINILVYVSALFVASVAFLLPIYTATNFGTWEHYISVFAAGALGKIVVDESLGLLISKKPQAQRAAAEP